jgi:hypothetical protein
MAKRFFLNAIKCRHRHLQTQKLCILSTVIFYLGIMMLDRWVAQNSRVWLGWISTVLLSIEVGFSPGKMTRRKKFRFVQISASNGDCASSFPSVPFCSLSLILSRTKRLKGIVQRKLRWVEIGINQQVLL